jgi:hypothetical protein
MSYEKDDYTKPVPTPVPTPTGPLEPSALPPGYEPQPYPKVVYHEDGRSKTVANELDEDTAELEGYTLDVPPQAVPDPEPK